jgi:hypothetical protein
VAPISALMADPITVAHDFADGVDWAIEGWSSGGGLLQVVGLVAKDEVASGPAVGPADREVGGCRIHMQTQSFHMTCVFW